ncbi:Wall-associated receptor kinase-like 8 [Morella rubra]|uniref:Wall-associated receptor kinase-like 8 n=1 Tax=Morella rubra TaxID=262757 RepID=A0A6A1UKX3_9ROSI|nr:Wall-associated receptor kinase-like 8 [Morella rubra]
MSFCGETGSVNASDCNGINCCQTAIPSVLDQPVKLTVKPINDRKVGKSVRSLAFICSCNNGYEGNPYLPEGCQDVDECADPHLNNCSRYLSYENGRSTHEKMGCKNTKGLTNATRLRTPGVSTGVGVPFLLICGWGSYKGLKKRKMMKRKEKFFKRNGGLLLQQQLSSSEVNVGNPNLFTSKDLEKATDHFNVNRILGQGGQGTVYKAMLPDGKIIAVKKSKVIGEEKIKEFINEVVILFNHRNVVKLLGCCLETEVPLLVYEFIPNGTLFQYLHNRNEDFSLTWNMRLRIATEIAGALFYLHSAASSPIYHRDINFGVVLAELLTGEKAIFSTIVQETKGLAAYFTDSMEENNLLNIIDNRVLEDGEKEEIIVVANLTRRCLNVSGRERPTMKEVATELEAVQVLRKATNHRLQQQRG